MTGPVDRRRFLGGALAAAGGLALGASKLPDLSFATRARRVVLGPDSIFDLPGSESPIDTVVILMLENRSFDHLLGWLGSDEEYLERGRRLHGRGFHVAAKTDVTYVDPQGDPIRTQEAFASLAGESGAVRGCTYGVPGHTWEQGRVQRDQGFVAEGSGNDEFAISYFGGSAIPYHRLTASSFTVYDRYFASLLGPTFPNRQYLHSAQSEGLKGDPGPLKSGIFTAPTIWDRLLAANVPATYYYTDVPLLRLWGPQLKPLIAPLKQFIEQALAGTLPNVAMVDPSFKGGERADGHPRGDVRLAAAFTALVAALMLASPQWERSMLVVTYDEWGGFFDHVAPRHFADDRASKQDAHDFGQAGFRVPAAILTPFSAPNLVDHTPYDHTSILRFLEWRFLGAPARGPQRGAGSQWWLTKRDRHANPVGQTLVSTPVNRDAEQLLEKAQRVHEPVKAPECADPDDPKGEPPFVTDPSFDEEIEAQYPSTTGLPWQASSTG